MIVLWHRRFKRKTIFATGVVGCALLQTQPISIMIVFTGRTVKRWQDQIWHHTKYKQTVQVCVERGLQSH